MERGKIRNIGGSELVNKVPKHVFQDKIGESVEIQDMIIYIIVCAGRNTSFVLRMNWR